MQSKKRVTKSRALRESGEKILDELALSEKDIENIFDILEEELPELWKNVQKNVLYWKSRARTVDQVRVRAELVPQQLRQD